MGAAADASCGAPYGERSDERINRNGYRDRRWDIRAGKNSDSICALAGADSSVADERFVPHRGR